MALLTNIDNKFSVSDAGAVTFNDAFTFPTADGTANYFLQTNGSGTIGWAAAPTGSGAANRVAYWTTASNISYNDSFRFDGSNVTITGRLDFVASAATYGPYITSTDGDDVQIHYNGNSGGDFEIWNHDQNGGAAVRMFHLSDDQTNLAAIFGSASKDVDVEIIGDIKVDGTFKDSSGDVGTAGQILSSTATGTNWINNSGGTITGSGAANQVTYWTSASAVDGAAGFTFAGGATGAITMGGALTVAGNVGIGATGLYSTARALNLPGKGISFKNDVNGSNNNWSYIYNTATGSSSNLVFATGQSLTALTLAHSGDATFAGSVGIGTTSTSSYDSESDDLVVFNSTTPGITIATDDTASRGALRFADGTNATEKYRGAVEYNHNGDAMSFRTAGVQRVTIDSSGQITNTMSGGKVLTDTNGFITSFQTLDTATAGGRYMGKSNRGLLGQMRIEQTATGADGGYISFDTCPAGSTTPASRMRIVAAGAVGIDNNSPDSFNGSGSTSSSLVIGKGTSSISPQLTLWQGNSAQATINFASANTGAGQYEGRIRYTRDTGVMDFRTNGVADVLVFSAAGNVGIGGAPGQNLDIQKSGARFRLIDGTNQFNMGLWDGSNYRFEGDANRPIYMTSYEGNINFGISGGTTMTIQSGEVGIGTTSPDAKLHIQGGSSDQKVLEISTAQLDGPYTAYKNTNSGTTTLGFIGNSQGIMNSGNTNFGIRANNDLTFSSGGATERMRIKSDGNVGIGTNDPDSLLVVQADAHNKAFAGKRSATEFLWFLRNESNSGRFQLMNSSNNTTIEMTAANGRVTQAQMVAGTAFALSNGGFATLGSTSSSVPIAIAIDGDASTASIVVPTNKNVCIGGVYNYAGTGVTSLNINGTDYPLLAFYSGSTLRTTLISYSNNTYFGHAHASAKWSYENGTGMMGELSGAGNFTVKGDVVAYGSPSDKRLKENIKPIESALDKVEKLQGVTFDWKDKKQDKAYDPDQGWKHDIGFIAQDVQKVVPELVRENEDGMLSMRHQGIAPILLEAIKELKAEVEELKKQIKQ